MRGARGTKRGAQRRDRRAIVVRVCCCHFRAQRMRVSHAVSVQIPGVAQLRGYEANTHSGRGNARETPFQQRSSASCTLFEHWRAHEQVCCRQLYTPQASARGVTAPRGYCRSITNKWLRAHAAVMARLWSRVRAGLCPAHTQQWPHFARRRAASRTMHGS